MDMDRACRRRWSKVYVDVDRMKVRTKDTGLSFSSSVLLIALYSPPFVLTNRTDT